MTQSVLPFPSLAYESPDASASPEGQALLDEWSNAMRAYFAPATRQPSPTERYPLTCGTIAQLRRLLDGQRLRIAEELVDHFLRAVIVEDVDLHTVRTLRAIDANDGSVLIEWTFEDRRLGFTIEPEVKDSGWYFVLSNASSQRFEAGSLDQLELPRLVKAMTHG